MTYDSITLYQYQYGCRRIHFSSNWARRWRNDKIPEAIELRDWRWLFFWENEYLFVSFFFFIFDSVYKNHMPVTIDWYMVHFCQGIYKMIHNLITIFLNVYHHSRYQFILQPRLSGSKWYHVWGGMSVYEDERNISYLEQFNLKIEVIYNQFIYEWIFCLFVLCFVCDSNHTLVSIWVSWKGEN